jgi:hypothetical protein
MKPAPIPGQYSNPVLGDRIAIPLGLRDWVWCRRNAYVERISNLEHITIVTRWGITVKHSAISVIVLIALFTLGGCAGMDAALKYTDTKVQTFPNGGDSWRIFDKPAEGRLMITPSIGESMKAGLISGATFGAADTDIPKPVYQRVVEAWFVHTRRRCTMTDGYKLIRPQWEFKYSCTRGSVGGSRDDTLQIPFPSGE